MKSHSRTNSSLKKTLGLEKRMRKVYNFNPFRSAEILGRSEKRSSGNRKWNKSRIRFTVFMSPFFSVETIALGYLVILCRFRTSTAATGFTGKKLRWWCLVVLAIDTSNWLFNDLCSHIRLLYSPMKFPQWFRCVFFKQEPENSLGHCLMTECVWLLFSFLYPNVLLEFTSLLWVCHSLWMYARKTRPHTS